MDQIEWFSSRVLFDGKADLLYQGGILQVRSQPPGVIVGVDPAPENASLITDWAKQYWEELHPTSAGGAYVNFLRDEGEDRVRTSYLGNYDRLSQVKARYDPENLFHVNQNIPPAARLPH